MELPNTEKLKKRIEELKAEITNLEAKKEELATLQETLHDTEVKEYAYRFAGGKTIVTQPHGSNKAKYIRIPSFPVIDKEGAIHCERMLFGMDENGNVNEFHYVENSLLDVYIFYNLMEKDLSTVQITDEEFVNKKKNGIRFLLDNIEKGKKQ